MTNDWIEWHWTPEKPYPETLYTEVFTMHKNGLCFDTYVDRETVGWWHDGHSSWDPKADVEGVITHYKLA